VPSHVFIDSIIYTVQGVWHGRCHYLWQEATAKSWFPKIETSKDSGAHMFDGKNNRLLDSFSFRLALTAAVFATWAGAGYMLLSLA
jgi:hypothetical protein